MNLIKPKKLKKGDKIALLSVSGDIRDIGKIKFAADYFEKQGYNTVISDTTFKKFRYHAGNDNERVEQFHRFLQDDSINAIVCTRGGYGLLRILNDIDYELVKSNPKIICGYSDITALLLMIYKKAGMVTFHGAMANGDFGDADVSSFTEKSFFQTLTDGKNLVFKAENFGKTLYEGRTSGTFWGGNLATISSMCGLDFIPDEKFVFFVEDVNEPAYKIDRMFTQLLNVEKFQKNIAGLVIGQFTDIDKPQYLEDMLLELSNKLEIPAATNFSISHDKNKFTLPVGVQCIFNANEKAVAIMESPFVD